MGATRRCHAGAAPPLPGNVPRRYGCSRTVSLAGSPMSALSKAVCEDAHQSSHQSPIKQPAHQSSEPPACGCSSKWCVRALHAEHPIRAAASPERAAACRRRLCVLTQARRASLTSPLAADTRCRPACPTSSRSPIAAPRERLSLAAKVFAGESLLFSPCLCRRCRRRRRRRWPRGQPSRTRRPRAGPCRRRYP